MVGALLYQQETEFGSIFTQCVLLCQLFVPTLMWGIMRETRMVAHNYAKIDAYNDNSHLYCDNLIGGIDSLIFDEMN